MVELVYFIIGEEPRAGQEAQIAAVFEREHAAAAGHDIDDPAPGAWTTVQGKKVQLFDSKKHRFRTFGAVTGKIGAISDIGQESIRVTAQGGQIEIFKVKPEGGKKISSSDFVREAGLSVGALLGA